MGSVLVWLDSEPIRTRAYPLLTVLVGYLATEGIVNGNIPSLILAIAAVVLGVPLTEIQRGKVTPIANGNGNGGRHAAPRKPEA